MKKKGSDIQFKSRLLRPASPKNATWTFLILPQSASAKLPSRGMTAVEGAINGAPFLSNLEPDGEGSHWLKLSEKLREAANANVGDDVALEIRPSDKVPDPSLPVNFRKALAENPEARALWSDITPRARRDWVHWITSAKKAETRERRVRNACEMLASGKRRVCCFDRSGMYSNSLGAPIPAD